MQDMTFGTAKSKGAEETKNYLRSKLQEYYCKSGGTQANCNANVAMLADYIYNTAEYIIQVQKSNPSRPVPVSIIVQYATKQMNALGSWSNNDRLACVTATTLLGFSIVEMGPSIAINGVIAASAWSTGLGIPIALGAGALAIGGAALLVWEGVGTFDSCKPLFASKSSMTSTAPIASPSSATTGSRQQAERYLNLLQHQMLTQPRSCVMSRT